MNLLSLENLMDMIIQSLNRMDERLTGHCERVAYGMMQLLKQDSRFSPEEIQKITCVVLLHDIGSFQIRDIEDLLEREYDQSFSHSKYGYLFLKYFSPFPEYAPFILYHHSGCSEIEGTDMEEKQKQAACCLQVIDTIDLYRVSHPKASASQVFQYISRLDADRYSQYALHTVQSLLQNPMLHFFAPSGQMHQALLDEIRKMKTNQTDLEALLETLIRSIDFRSHYTALHCAIMVKISDHLAKLCNLDQDTRECLHLGAMLHDLGKIAIPTHILEAPGKLTGEDWEIMKSHVVLTKEILQNRVSDEVLQIAIRHHETLDGKGYPYGIPGSQLTLPQRIVAVADIVSALSEERSYKASFSLEDILRILEDMCQKGKICPYVLGVMKNHKEELYRTARQTAADTSAWYDRIYAEYSS